MAASRLDRAGAAGPGVDWRGLAAQAYTKCGLQHPTTTVHMHNIGLCRFSQKGSHIVKKRGSTIGQRNLRNTSHSIKGRQAQRPLPPPPNRATPHRSTLHTLCRSRFRWARVPLHSNWFTAQQRCLPTCIHKHVFDAASVSFIWCTGLGRLPLRQANLSRIAATTKQAPHMLGCH